jgi:urea transporter
MAVEHRKLIKEGYFYFDLFLFLFIFFDFFCFQPGAVFPAICCILELKFVFACILELESPLCGFCGLLVSMVFVFFLWFLGSRSLLVSVACVASVDFVAFGCFW